VLELNLAIRPISWKNIRIRMKILADYGSTEDLAFDLYATPPDYIFIMQIE